MTAVDWFIKELIKEGYYIPKGIGEQAKQMEKEQLNVARLDGINLANKGYGK